jgi:hypothetical protein
MGSLCLAIDFQIRDIRGSRKKVFRGEKKVLGGERRFLGV